ncbi:MAG TPA: segregation/condensation protein A [Phycisphaerae bacterium]|nr:segregation/condensation protein A [Phycisphaerae bacterium]
MPDYSVQIDVYNGPLDLLLYLIRREEVDIYDIPVARVTEQYLAYVDTLKIIDPNIAGDFLVMAATLMEIKSRMLLPHPPAEQVEAEDLSDPRLELVRQLLEYKKFKDASLELGSAAEIAAQRWPRVPAGGAPQPQSEIDLEEVQIWDLVAAFNKLMSAIGAGATSHDVVFDDTPIALHATDILDRIQGEGGEMSFERIFAGRTRAEMIGLFLALLELMRQQRVRITQSEIFAPIMIVLLSAEPIQVGSEWEPRTVLGATTTHDPGPAPGSAAEVTESPKLETESSEGAEEEEDDESFAELDQIKTDVDIDAILREEPRDSTKEGS